MHDGADEQSNGIGDEMAFATFDHLLRRYLVLVSLAWNNQLITYGALSQRQMKYGDGGILAPVLGCIMGWCHELGLPPLTTLVVNGDTGVPGGGLITVADADFPAAMQRVFKFNWFDLVPPTVAELEACGNRAKAGQLRNPG
jgi:hypothetical protein